ncbi:MAG: S46 family peptidase [Acidobacteriota bacterium]
MKRNRFIFFLSLLIFTIISFIFADEGMWLFNKPPTDYLKKKYGFEITSEWLKHVQLSSIRFGGASASFVSPDGVVLTNHHVGSGAIQNLSTKDRDLMKTGFYAKTKAEELKCPGVEIHVLMEIEDVTDLVNSVVTPQMTSSEANEAQQKKIASIEKECSEKTGLFCQVINLYSGGMFHLYKFKRYTDVRLVFAPEFPIAFFGGDPDNFTYPRYDLDVCFFRVYENDKPIKSPDYLKWSTEGVKEGELVFASGNPGSTGRLLTMTQLKYLRDFSYPYSIANLKRQRALLTEFSKKSEEHARIAQRSLFGVENSLKAITGYQSGLLDEKIMEKKQKEEKAFREEINKDSEMQKEFGKAWDEIEKAQKSLVTFYKSLSLLERAGGFRTTYFRIAKTLVRIAMEKPKPNEERLREFRESNLPSITRSILSQAPIYDELEVVTLTNSLAQLKEECTEYPELTEKIFKGRSAEEVANELIKGTKLKDVEERKKYIDGGIEAVNKSEDPMIKLALLIDPVSRELRDRYEKEVESVETKNGALIAKAMFKLRGTSIPPDATGTLRLSFGPVKSYVEDGKKIHFQTTYRGLYEWADKHGNKPPWELPKSFIEKKSALNLDVPLNFVSTLDSIGGNSGSPVINTKAELVGVLFDGNIQSLPNRFVYTDEIARSVMVHSQGIIEALIKVYGAFELVDEIIGKK